MKQWAKCIFMKVYIKKRSTVCRTNIMPALVLHLTYKVIDNYTIHSPYIELSKKKRETIRGVT